MPGPSTPPAAGVPSGNGKYIVIAVLLLGGIGGISYVLLTKTQQPTVVIMEAGTPDAAPTTVNTGRNPDDDIPLPPPVIDASVPTTTSSGGTTSAGSYQCNVSKCGGTTSSDLETALSFRTKQAHRCYDTALSQDPTLKGKVTVAVRVGTNGSTCSASIVSNDMGSSTVGNCVANYFRGQSFPAPKGGCVDVQVPINFVPRQ